MADEPIELEPPKTLIFADGDYTGADGASGRTPPGVVSGFSPATCSFWQVPALTPGVAKRQPLLPVTSKRLVYINGINTLRHDHAYTLKLIAVVTGAEVIGIYNQSGDGGGDTDMLGDLLQSVGDKLGISRNPTTATLEKAVFDACTSGVPLNVVAHSQGAIITSRGIRNAIRRLRIFFGRQDEETSRMMDLADRRRNLFDRFYTDADERRRNELVRERIMPRVERALKSYVSVQTFGGAASFFPDGPVYRHVYNAFDPVAFLFGQGNPIHGGGRGSESERLSRNSASPLPDFSPDHSVNNIYLQPSQFYVDRRGRRVDSNYFPIDMGLVR